MYIDYILIYYDATAWLTEKYLKNDWTLWNQENDNQF